jgi:hypothetical protein
MLNVKTQHNIIFAVRATVEAKCLLKKECEFVRHKIFDGWNNG